MKKVEINQRIIESLGLSENEGRIFAVLLSYQIGRNVSAISRQAGIPRTTTFDILEKLEERKLVMRVKYGERYHWRYKMGLERLMYKSGMADLAIGGSFEELENE